MKLNKYLLLLISFSAFMACSKEIGEESKEPEAPKGPVALDPHIAGVSLTTRGGAANATDINTLGIYAVPVKTEGAPTDAPSSYHLYKLTNGNATPNDVANTLWLELYKVTIFSFHPAGAADATPVTPEGTDETPVPTITIPASAITAEQTGITEKDDNNYDFAKTENDYMYGVAYDKSKEDNSNPYLVKQPIANNGYASGDTPQPNECGPEIAIGLKHAFAQIRFILKKSSSYGGEAIVSKVTYVRNLQTLIGKLKEEPTAPTAETGVAPTVSDERLPITMNLTNGTLNNLAAAAATTYSYTFAEGQNVKATNDNSTTVKLTNYILPNTSTNATITITVDGKEMKLERSSDTQFEAGNIYTYNIVINPTGLTLSGFTVSGWGEDLQQPGITI